MISKFGTDASITKALKAYEYNFVVVANPDGYEYSQTNDRMWRKTRATNSGTLCVPERNVGIATLSVLDPNHQMRTHLMRCVPLHFCSAASCAKERFLRIFLEITELASQREQS